MSKTTRLQIRIHRAQQHCRHRKGKSAWKEFNEINASWFCGRVYLFLLKINNLATFFNAPWQWKQSWTVCNSPSYYSSTSKQLLEKNTWHSRSVGSLSRPERRTQTPFILVLTRLKLEMMLWAFCNNVFLLIAVFFLVLMLKLNSHRTCRIQTQGYNKASFFAKSARLTLNKCENTAKRW